MDREIRPRLRLIWMMVIGLMLLFGGMLLTSTGSTFPPGMLLMAFGLIALVRSLVIVVVGGHEDSPFATNPRVGAATLAPFGLAGIVLFLAYASGTLPGGFGAAILCLVFTGGVVYWIFQYRLGEMTYQDGIWVSRERWLDPPVSKATQDRWASDKARKASRRS